MHGRPHNDVDGATLALARRPVVPQSRRAMTNVVFLEQRRRGASGPAQPAGEAGGAALLTELAAIVERLWAAGDRAAALPHTPYAVERTAQALLDAIAAVERAMSEITDEGGPIPS